MTSGKVDVTAYETFEQWMISDAAALMAPDSTVTITLINVIADGDLSPRCRRRDRLRDGCLTLFYVTSVPPVPSPMWAIRHEGEVMRELPDLRHPALAARGRHPILAVYDGSAASKHVLAYAAGLARRTDRWLQKGADGISGRSPWAWRWATMAGLVLAG